MSPASLIRSAGLTGPQLSLCLSLCFFLNPQSLPVRSRDLLMLVMRTDLKVAENQLMAGMHYF
jgi:hypothetical protein